MRYAINKYGIFQKDDRDISCLYCRSTPMEKQVWPCNDNCAAFEYQGPYKLEHGAQMSARVILHCCDRAIDVESLPTERGQK